MKFSRFVAETLDHMFIPGFLIKEGLDICTAKTMIKDALMNEENIMTELVASEGAQPRHCTFIPFTDENDNAYICIFLRKVHGAECRVLVEGAVVKLLDPKNQDMVDWIDCDNPDFVNIKGEVAHLFKKEDVSVDTEKTDNIERNRIFRYKLKNFGQLFEIPPCQGILYENDAEYFLETGFLMHDFLDEVPSIPNKSTVIFKDLNEFWGKLEKMA